MFKVYDRYMLRQLTIATAVVAGGLSMVILLTQSLRLIELVLKSNASAHAFLTLIALSFPRFVEAVLPASVLISTLFVFHRLAMDSEMIVLRASGASPLRLVRPVITSGIIFAVTLLALSLFISPVGISQMQTMRKEIRAQYAHLLFREGVFNTVGEDLTAYVRQQAQDGRLVGLMVHDTRGVDKGGPAVTVVAQSGNIVSEKDGQKIIVYDGARQELDPKTGKFSRLDFKQYTLEIPSSGREADERWREADERTLGELTNAESLVDVDATQRLQFRAELHRRLSTPLLMISFAMLAASCLLLGPYSRSGNVPLVTAAAVSGLILQGLYLFVFSFAKKTALGCALLYIVAATPVLASLFFLSTTGEQVLARISRTLNRYLHKGA
jgi:lipopolysaccharide export system permease protein